MRTTFNTIVLLVLAVAALLNAYYGFYWMADDSYISIRYALNYVNSGQLFYNRHELDTGLVQGFSNPGMLPVYILLLKFSPDVMLSLKILGTLALVGISALVFSLSRRFGASRGVGLAASIAVASSPILGGPATSGLETIFLGFLLTLSFWLLTSGSARCKVASALTFAYCVSMRPEGLALCIALLGVFAVYKWVSPGLSKQSAVHAAPIPALFGEHTWRWLALFAGLTAVYLAWQYSNYSSFFPNTATTKAGGVDIASFFTASRYKYLFDFFAYNMGYGALWLFGILIFLVGALMRKISAAAWVAAALCSPGFALAILGRQDYFPNFRYIAPYFPLFIVFIALTLDSLLVRVRYRWAVVAPVLALFLYGFAMDIKTDSVMNNKFAFAAKVDRSEKDFQSFRKYVGSYWTPFPGQSDLFALFAPEDGVVSYGNIGHPGVNAMDVQILDSVGLVTREFAMFRSGRPGGEAAAVALMNAYRPDIYVVGIQDLMQQNLIAPLIADGYVERDWLKGDRENVFISSSSFAPDGGSALPLAVALNRHREISRVLPGDYQSVVRYRDLLYLSQRTSDLQALLAEFSGRRDFKWYADTIGAVRSFPFELLPAGASMENKPVVAEKNAQGGLSIDLKRELFQTFRAFNFNVQGGKNTRIPIDAEICSDERCAPLAGLSVLTDDSGFARLSLVFDRFELLFPMQAIPKVVNPRILYAYAGLPSSDDASHAVGLLPTDLPQVLNGRINVSISGDAKAGVELKLTGVR